MRKLVLTSIVAAWGIVAAFGAIAPAQAQDAATIDSRFAEVNGTKLHYLVAGSGDPVILLHGYAQTSHMWRPLIAELARTHLVIAPDLRGFGELGQAGKRLRQEDDGRGRPCACRIARP